MKKTAHSQEEAFQRLVNIVKLLRKECPWDKRQNHESLKPCLIEEAYEVVEAINNRDIDNLREELGDVFLQVVFHGILGEEEGNFSLTEIINEECEKMIRRHPHIFSKEEAKSVDKVLEKWENIKEKEHGILSESQKLQQVPKALPALIRSSKVQKKAAQVGFDWEDVSEAFLKITEEQNELLEAKDFLSQERIEEELGDLLFAVVNVARFLNVEPEGALHGTTEKFIGRFAFIEEEATKRGYELKKLSLEEMDKLWDKAKAKEKERLQLQKF